MSENLFYLNHIHSALQYELQSKEKELATLPKGNLYTKPRKDGIHLCWSHQSSQNNTSKRQQKMLSETPKIPVCFSVPLKHYCVAD